MFLVFFLWFQNYSITGSSRLVDIGLSAFFLFQGLLTFSRGGIIGSIIVCVILLFYHNRIRLQKKATANIRMKFIFGGLPILILVMIVANNITDGKLLLRYQGETNGTLLGVKEKNLNTITTGRLDIFSGDMGTFFQHPLFGVGVNESRYYREYLHGVVAHVELSRLLSEHGILGMIIFTFFLLSIYTGWKIRKINILFFLLSILGVYTTFHAATRTFLSPLLMALAFIPEKSIKNKLS
jgi:hypothetical protein